MKQINIAIAVSAGVFALAFAAWPAKAQISPTEAQPSIQIVHTPVPAARKTVTGIFTRECVLTVNKDLPNGTMINFTGYTSVSDTAVSNTHSVSITGKVAGAADKVSPYLSASAGEFTSEPTYNFSADFQSTVPLPANAATTIVISSGSI